MFADVAVRIPEQTFYVGHRAVWVSLFDFRVFDSSIEKGKPLNFRVGQMVAGWNEALPDAVDGSPRNRCKYALTGGPVDSSSTASPSDENRAAL